MQDFLCTRCGNRKSEGCGMPDYKVPVPYENGSVKMETPACPLVPIATGHTPLSKDQQLALMSDALRKINDTIFGGGATLGSDAYFTIRKECVDTLWVCGFYVR